MKLIILLVVVGTVCSVPLETEEREKTGPMAKATEQTPTDMTKDMEAVTEEAMEDTNTTMDAYFQAMLDEVGSIPSEAFTEELKQYFEEQQKIKQQPKRVARQLTSALYHGSHIALQTFVRNHWLSCWGFPGNTCGRRTCPKMIFSGSDWNNCGGETFNIYRSSGPGTVRVGDIVGLRYGGNLWLGCPGSTCGLSACPGYASTSYGFHSADLWYRCWGEVFRIYARGKGLGATVNSNDDISLYYIQGDSWVVQVYHQTHKSPCTGTARPPPFSFYDICYGETFRVWKQ